MTTTQVIDRADLLRPNGIPKEMKRKWVLDLDGQLAEMYGTEPDGDELLAQPPHDEVYVLHLCAQIDLAQEETDLYQDDMAQANLAMSELRAWYRRNHCPDKGVYRKKGVYH